MRATCECRAGSITGPVTIKSVEAKPRRFAWLSPFLVVLLGTVVVAFLLAEALSPLGSPRGRRHRQVVEIHDALRQLRPWYRPDVYLSAQRRAQRNRLDPAAVRTIAEAAGIAVAIRRKLAGVDGDTEAIHAEPCTDLPASLKPAARELARLSHAMHHSPLVTAEVAKWGSVVTGGGPATLIELRPQHPAERSRVA